MKWLLLVLCFFLAPFVCVGQSDLGSIHGFNLTWSSTNSVTVSKGIYIYPSGNGKASLTNSVTISLVDDLDEGSVKTNTWYSIHVYQDDNDGSVGAVFSTNSIAPFGQVNSWRIGKIYNLQTKMRKFIQTGSGELRTYRYYTNRTNLYVVTDGAETSFTIIDFTMFVPMGAHLANVEIAFKSGGQGSSADKAFLRLDAGATTSHYAAGVKSTRKYITHEQLQVADDCTMEYKVSDNANEFDILVLGWIDEL